MINYVLDYMEEKGSYADTAKENAKLIEGIRLYLVENGISEGETREYFKQYISQHMEIIENSDLKSYFLMYPLISRVNQIAIEFKTDGMVPRDKADELYHLMEQLYAQGIGDKYVPAIEIKEILGRLV